MVRDLEAGGKSLPLVWYFVAAAKDTGLTICRRQLVVGIVGVRSHVGIDKSGVKWP